MPGTVARAATDSAASAKPRRRKIRLAVILLVLLGVGFGAFRFIRSIGHEATDNAQINGELDPVIPRVAGTVAELLVRDNDRVKVGQPLLRIDPHELDAKVAAAEAALAQAKANVESARGNAVVADANVAAQLVEVNREQVDLRRSERLFQEHGIAEENVQTARADAESAQAKYRALQKQADAARAQITLSEAAVRQREADLEVARLQRSYATVVAPIAGIVSRRTVEPGQFVQAGQPVLAIVGTAGFWVIANFKETQLKSIRPGQEAVVRVDAYPGIKFRGKVDSIAGATGARFALLPPDNASGNWVKVTQRVPVKITVPDGQNPDHPLRLGLSAYAAITVR